MNKRTRVLIVDDDERNVKILYEILEDEFELYSAGDGELALIEVEKSSPDVILLDIMMPGINGYEVCRRVKNSANYRGIKIILVSGKGLTEERLKGYEAGADDFVVKPFDMDEIYAKVQVFAKLKSMEEVNKLKTDFLNLINHETGTPLNHIIGVTNLLLMNNNLSGDVLGGIKDISNAANNLNNKISNILFLSKLKQETLSDFTDIDISSMLLEIQSFLGDIAENINIEFNAVEGQSFKGDFTLIQKLFLYLFRNAVAVSDSIICCRAKCSTNKNGMLGILFEIEDSRADISDFQLENFFDPFYVDDLMLHGEGLNTTMAICSEISHLHHGTIDIKRNESSGACLSVWLPFDPTE